MKKATLFLSTLSLILFSSAATNAQESEVRVVDEVVAVVNDGVITLSRVRRETDVAIKALMEDGKTREEATRLVEENKGDIIASLINEELLIQKGKEVGVESEVEAQINQRFLQLMRQQNFRSVETLYKEMEKQGVSPETVRDGWRKQITQDLVLQREVDGKVYWGWSARELRAYYDKNKEKFTKPERVTLQEIFLAFAGRDEAAVREKAKNLVAQLREGADFGTVAIANSDRPDVKQSRGEVGKFSYAQLKDINEIFVEPIRSTKVGGITDPIETVEGLEIFAILAREDASTESVFEEAEVRRAATFEILSQKRKEYFISLREEAYIKINDSYRPIVAPILYADERKSSTK